MLAICRWYFNIVQLYFISRSQCPYLFPLHFHNFKVFLMQLTSHSCCCWWWSWCLRLRPTVFCSFIIFDRSFGRSLFAFVCLFVCSLIHSRLCSISSLIILALFAQAFLLIGQRSCDSLIVCVLFLPKSIKAKNTRMMMIMMMMI